MRYILLFMALLLGACALNPAASTTNIVTPTVQSSATPTIAATQTAIFHWENGMGGFPAITLEQIGEIPANTRVNIDSAMLLDEWIYGISDQFGHTADARESQLAYAPDVTPGVAPPIFMGTIGMGGFPAITLEQIGNIPANARVSISSATREDEWVYSIYDENGNRENARESQLAYGPDVTPGAPTPTSAYHELLQQGTVYARTLVDVEGIPVGTIVRLGPSHNGDGEIVYLIYNDELGLAGEIPESQLEVVEVEPYVVSTEVPTQRP